MNTKENLETKKFFIYKDEKKQSRPKSLRPMHSLIAIRSLKPKTVATGFMPIKPAEESKTN